MKLSLLTSIAAVGLAVGCGEYQGDRSDTTMTTERPPAVDSSQMPGDSMATMTLQDLPPAVQETVRTHAGNAQIADIDKETRTGRVIYEISFADPGLNPKIHVAEDGTLVESDLDEADSALGTPGDSIQSGQGQQSQPQPDLNLNDGPDTQTDRPVQPQEDLQSQEDRQLQPQQNSGNDL